MMKKGWKFPVIFFYSKMYLFEIESEKEQY